MKRRGLGGLGPPKKKTCFGRVRGGSLRPPIKKRPFSERWVGGPMEHPTKKDLFSKQVFLIRGLRAPPPTLPKKVFVRVGRGAWRSPINNRPFFGRVKGGPRGSLPKKTYFGKL